MYENNLKFKIQYKKSTQYYISKTQNVPFFMKLADIVV